MFFLTVRAHISGGSLDILNSVPVAERQLGSLAHPGWKTFDFLAYAGRDMTICTVKKNI
jgi:hypothetical protein